MDDVRNPMYAAEPYEESQGREDYSFVSPDALAAFYKDMEKKEVLERKLSKRKSNSGTSLWSRKSLKRSATAPPVPPPAQAMHPPKSDGEHLGEHKGEDSGGAEVNRKDIREEKDTKPDWVPQAHSPRSVIPDAKDLPAWYNKDIWTSVPVPSFTLRYPIHNPVGPRWYKNHHLVPPSQTTPAARPPSFFSPSFPPMTSSAPQDRPDDPSHLPGPSRTPSNSPLPTPNSSQTRVVDKPRSRKTSQTAHDNVDLWDVTDPWGTNWHHHSPYDVGLVNGPISVDVQDALHTRSRRSSVGAQSRKNKVSPSPLSQSTSAVHLQMEAPDMGAHLPRKLSKRRTPAVGNIFKSRSEDLGRGAVSLPTSPVEAPPPTDLPKRMSVAPPVGLSMATKQSLSPRKEKRGSVLGRLAKKFSLLKKPTYDYVRGAAREDDCLGDSPDITVMNDIPRHDVLLERRASPEKRNSSAVKRVPAPLIEGPPVKLDTTSKDADRSSSLSLEAPFSMGRLTIANPDTPISGQTTPVHGEIPLPPDKDYMTHRVSSQDKPSLPSLPLVSPLSVNTLVLPPKTPSPPPPPSKELPLGTSPLTGKRPPSADQQSPVSQLGFSSSVTRATSAISQGTVREAQLASPSSETVTTLLRLPHESSSQKPIQEQVLSQQSERPQLIPPEKHARSGSVVSSVPFPGGHEHDASSLAYDNSPLSAASMLANPPTPYSKELPMPSAPENLPPAPPAKVPVDVSSLDRMTRQTETFKLVRSPSGHIYASNETIVAGGQQWEVVGADKEKNRGSSSSKDRTSRNRNTKTLESTDRHYQERDTTERDSRDRETRDRKYRSRARDYEDRDFKDRVSGGRIHEEGTTRDRESTRRLEKRRESKVKPESDSRHQQRNQREQKLKRGERSTPTSQAITQVDDVNTRHRDGGATAPQHGTHSSSHRREDPERRPERKQRKASPQSPSSVQAQASPPVSVADVSSRPLGRHPSLSARPTSQLPSADEMNAMRAKEAWDMERLWKARSMQGDEFNRYTTMPNIPSNHNTPVLDSNNDTNLQGAIYGSSHTAFVVQTPFRSQNPIYHSMPAVPPPIIYSSPSFLPTVTNQLPLKNRSSQHQRYPDSIVSDEITYTSRQYNPLPPPPRESTYEIPSDARSSDYWSKHAGIATSTSS